MWVRMPAVGQTVAAAYGRITNNTATEVTVMSVRSDVGRAELHETTSDPQGVMKMGERTDGFLLAPDATLSLEPGRAHVMLCEVDLLSLRLAEAVTLEFEIADWGILEISATVRGLDHMTAKPAESLDINALHQLDDDLRDGVLDPVSQRRVVADALTTTAVVQFPADFDTAAVISALYKLDEALIAEDVRTAAQWAFIVHDLAHALEPLHSH